jgi:UDP-N-acetylmuramoylalanine--D-glutamate ligase
MEGIESAAGGNIGAPLTEVAPTVSSGGAIAVEVSSFQIEDLSEYRSRAAALLNVTPDHLDRHGSLDAYRDIKARLLELVEPEGYRVLNADDPNLSELVARSRVDHGERTLVFSMSPTRDRGAYREGDRLVLNLERPTKFATVAGLAIPGPHNVQNALAAALLAVVHGVDPGTLATAFRTFRPLRHRMERVARVGRVLFVNDSKATNLDSLRMALQSFAAREVVLIAGGRDKGSPFEDLAALVAEQVRHLVLLGEAAGTMAEAWSAVPTTRAETLEEAVRLAMSAAQPAGVVLLAPGCTSFDMFTNFEDRGDRFCSAVRALTQESS